MKKIMLILLIFCLSISMHAQFSEASHMIGAEFNGIATLNLGYDYVLPVHEKVALLGGVDYVMGIGFGYGSHWIVPEIGTNFFGNRHNLETSLLYAWDVSNHEFEPEHSPGIRIAYRYETKIDVFARISLSVFPKIDPILIPNIGIGYHFRKT